MNWLVARLKEPSTHAAVAGAIAAFMPLIPSPYGAVAVSVFAALGFILPASK